MKQATAPPSRAETSLLGLLQGVALATNQASTVEQAAAECLEAVCAFMRWPVGHLYLRPADSLTDLVSTEVWHLDDPERFGVLRQVTEATPLAVGVGLPGQVLAGGGPVWIEDVTRHPNFPRAQMAADIEVRAAFAFPILATGEVVGVLEFFSSEAVEPEPRLLEVATHIGMQLGLVLERARAERALRESELRFRSVAQSANDAIVSADAAGVIVFWNRAAARIFGYSEAEAMGAPLTMIMPERYHEAHLLGLARVISTGESRVIGRLVQLHGLRKDGTEFPMELSLTTWTTEEGTFFSGAIRDVTDRQRQLRKLARSETERDALARQAQQAQEANRLKDEFLATLSHELRTPLMSMLGWSHLLRGGGLDEATSKRALESIERNTLLQSRLVEDLLDVSRIVAGKLRLEMRRIELAPVVTAALDVARPEAEAKGIELQASLSTLPEPMWGDPIRLQQIVGNLLSNAVKFTPEGGRVEVTLEPAGSRAVLRVSDNGRGIPADFLPHVFDRFRQAESFMSRAEGGLGLGLALALHLVNLHGGTVTAESAGEGRGATFTVELPVGGASLDDARVAELTRQEVEP